MQDYKLFIAEINRLDVKTKQLFVKNGQVLDDVYHNPKWYEGHPQERWPGDYLSTFYDFDKYNLDRETDNYDKQLIILRENAFTDLVLLPSDRLEIVIADLKYKRDKFDRLSKQASMLHREYLLQDFDKASSYEYNLFQSLGAVQITGVSLEEKSAHNLKDAVYSKRGQLHAILNQLERLNQGDADSSANDGKPGIEDQNQPDIYITPESRQILIDAIKPYVDTPHRSSLQALIAEGRLPEPKIQHHATQNILAYFFHQLHKQKKTSASHKEISEWICQSFTPATNTTIYDVVRGVKLPSESSRVEIRF